ncbi:hypothetical protein ACTFIY_011698 [Dictyostelium cf. discoideum]
MINGEPSIPFNIERGVRQCDPLSSTLFVLVIEVLAANILNDPQIKGIPLNEPNSIFIKFLQYADDSSSISPSYREFNRIIYHFNRFCKSTSSKINFDKSSIIEIPWISLQSQWHLPSSANNPQNNKIVYLTMEIEQDYKAIDELITWFMSAPTPSNSTNNIGTSTTKNISKTTTLMCKNRNLKPMNKGGWDNTATYVKHWTLELNNPKSPFLIEIKTKWEDFKLSFTNTLFRFHSRCPINHLHKQKCPSCNTNMNDDPYGHLFIHCTITRHYINIPTLSQNIYKITNNPNNPSTQSLTQNSNQTTTCTAITYRIVTLPENSNGHTETSTSTSTELKHTETTYQ